MGITRSKVNFSSAVKIAQAHLRGGLNLMSLLEMVRDVGIMILVGDAPLLHTAFNLNLNFISTSTNARATFDMLRLDMGKLELCIWRDTQRWDSLFHGFATVSAEHWAASQTPLPSHRKFSCAMSVRHRMVPALDLSGSTVAGAWR